MSVDRLHALDRCAQAPARALREAAQFFERDMSRAWGGDAQWLTTGTRIAGLVADVLRERAADLDAARVAGVLTADTEAAERTLTAIMEVVEMYESCGPKQQSTRDVLAAVREVAGVNPFEAQCPTCAHPEGYDRLSGPCPTCHGDGAAPRSAR